MSTKEEQQQKYRRLIKMPKVKFISAVFKHRDEIQSIVYEKRNDPGKGKVLVPGGGFYSSPTETKAMRNITLIGMAKCEDGFWVRYPEKWLYAINKALEICADEASRNAIAMWQDGYSAEFIAHSTGLSRTSIYDIRKEVQHYAVAIAAQMGLINVLKYKRSDEYAGDGGEEEHQEEASKQEHQGGADGEAGSVEDSEAGIPVQE